MRPARAPPKASPSTHRATSTARRSDQKRSRNIQRNRSWCHQVTNSQLWIRMNGEDILRGLVLVLFIPAIGAVVAYPDRASVDGDGAERRASSPGADRVGRRDLEQPSNRNQRRRHALLRNSSCGTRHVLGWPSASKAAPGVVLVDVGSQPRDGGLSLSSVLPVQDFLTRRTAAVMPAKESVCTSGA